jgi:hypothetical protein
VSDAAVASDTVKITVHVNRPLGLALPARVARFLLAQPTKTGEKNYPSTTKYTNRPINIPSGSKICQRATKFTNISDSKASLIYPNRDFWFGNEPSEANPITLEFTTTTPAL